MGTNANVAIENEDGTIDSVYVHFDGMPSRMMPLLTAHYADRDKARALVDLGDMSVVREFLGQKHDFGKAMPGWTVAYHRDRNESWNTVKPKRYSNREMFRIEVRRPYKYLFTSENRWIQV